MDNYTIELEAEHMRGGGQELAGGLLVYSYSKGANISTVEACVSIISRWIIHNASHDEEQLEEGR